MLLLLASDSVAVFIVFLAADVDVVVDDVVAVVAVVYNLVVSILCYVSLEKYIYGKTAPLILENGHTSCRGFNKNYNMKKTVNNKSYSNIEYKTKLTDYSTLIRDL